VLSPATWASQLRRPRLSLVARETTARGCGTYITSVPSRPASPADATTLRRTSATTGNRLPQTLVKGSVLTAKRVRSGPARARPSPWCSAGGLTGLADSLCDSSGIKGTTHYLRPQTWRCTINSLKCCQCPGKATTHQAWRNRPISTASFSMSLDPLVRD